MFLFIFDLTVAVPDLRYKYDLLVSASDIIDHARSVEQDEKSVEVDDADDKDVIGSIRSNWANVSDLWDDSNLWVRCGGALYGLQGATRPSMPIITMCCPAAPCTRANGID